MQDGTIASTSEISIDLNFILPAIFTAAVGYFMWSVKTKLTDMKTDIDKIKENTTSLILNNEKAHGEMVMEVKDLEIKLTETYATKLELARVEEKMDLVPLQAN